MISNQVSRKLAEIYAHPNAAQARRSSGEGYASHEAHREVDVFHSVKGQDADLDGKISTRGPGHCLMVPWSREAEYQGCLQNGVMHRVDGLFVASTTEPTFKTYIETQFHPDRILKREASEGGAETVVRTVSVHHTDPSQNYVEEFRIAR